MEPEIKITKYMFDEKTNLIDLFIGVADAIELSDELSEVTNGDDLRTLMIATIMRAYEIGWERGSRK